MMTIADNMMHRNRSKRRLPLLLHVDACVHVHDGLVTNYYDQYWQCDIENDFDRVRHRK